MSFEPRDYLSHIADIRTGFGRSGHVVAKALRGMGLTVVLLSFHGCSDPLASSISSDSVNIRQLDLEEIEILPRIAGQQGIIELRAQSSMPLAFEQRDRIRVTLQALDGSEEELLLRPQVCTMTAASLPSLPSGTSLPVGGQYHCDRFLLVASSEAQLEALLPLIYALPAEPIMTEVCSQDGTCHTTPSTGRMVDVRVTEGDLFSAMRQAARWSGVDEIHIGFATAGGGWSTIQARTPRFRGNSSLATLTESAPMTITYELPTGSILSSTESPASGSPD